MGDDIARNLLPTVDTFRKAGETSFKTLERLSNEFIGLQRGAISLGASLSYAKDLLKNSTFEGRAAFVDAAGGLEALVQKTTFFSENFLTEAERLGPVQDRLNSELSELGISSDITEDQFKSLVQSFGTVNGVSEETLQVLLDLAPAFVTVRNATEELTKVAEANAKAAEENAKAQQQLEINVRSGLISEAFSSLQRSVQTERDRLTENYNTSLAAVNDHIQLITSSISKLKSFSDSLKATVNELRPMDREFAQRIVKNAIKSGNFETPQLQFAIDALKNQSTTGFSSSFEFARSQAKSVSLLTELGDAADDQVSGQEEMLAEFNSQKVSLEYGFNREIERLDGILAQGQKQIDALNGINNAVISVAAAISQFNLRINQAGGGGGIVDPTLGYAPVATIPKPSGKEIFDYFNVPRTAEEIYKDAIKFGISSQDVIDSGRFTPAEVEKFFTDNPRIKRFAAGGYHAGGLRIVGERGPELEYTGPSRITSNQDIRRATGNDDLIAEIKLMRKQQEETNKQIVKLANDNREMRKIWRSVTRGGTTIRTEAA